MPRWVQSELEEHGALEALTFVSSSLTLGTMIKEVRKVGVLIGLENHDVSYLGM